MALVGLGIVGRGDARDLAVFHFDLQVAAHAAIGAHGAHHLIGLGLLGAEHVGDGAGGAGLRAGAAAHAVAVLEALAGALGDPAVEAAAGHGEHHLALHLVAGPHAAVAIDATAEVADHVRVRSVLGEGGVGPGGIERMGALGVAHAVQVEADLLHHVVELVLPVVLGLELLHRVVGEHQLHDVLAQPLHARAVHRDVLPLGDRRVAAGHHLGGTVLLQGHLHAAHAAAAERLQVGRVAERGHGVGTQVPLQEGEHRFPLVDGEGHTIDVGDVDLGGSDGRGLGFGAGIGHPGHGRTG